jgi:hypothetical protein
VYVRMCVCVRAHARVKFKSGTLLSELAIAHKQR